MPRKPTHVDLFAGIGGLALGFAREGFRTIALVENHKQRQAVLRRRFPKVPLHDDVKKFKRSSVHESVDVISAGFPCQDISRARALRTGADARRFLQGEKSGLFFEAARIVRAYRPKIVVFENVTDIIAREGGAGTVLAELARIGYDAEWHVIRGTDLGIPQKRPRVFIIAYPAGTFARPVLDYDTFNAARDRLAKDQDGNVGKLPDVDDSDCAEVSRALCRDPDWPSILNGRGSGGGDGFSGRMDRYAGVGNSVIPQVGQVIAYAIRQAWKRKR